MNLRAVTLISGSLASALSSFSVNDDNLSGGTDATSLSWLKSRGPGWPEGRAAREYGEMSREGDKVPNITFAQLRFTECRGQVVHTRHM